MLQIQTSPFARQSVSPGISFSKTLGCAESSRTFSGGQVSSDGALLLRQVDAGLGVTRALAGCFVDRRDPELLDHSVQELLAQRIYGLALGYEDLNDHAHLRRDPLLAERAP
jgi:hypothetical protein